MLDRIDTVGKILALSIPEIKCIINESKRPVIGPDYSFDFESYLRNFEEGQITLAFQAFAIRIRLETPHNLIQDPPRPIHIPRTKAIVREHRKLHQCLRIIEAEIEERLGYLQLAQDNGWYQRIL